MWDIGWQFCFLSYLLMGYKLRKWAETRKNNALAATLLVGGLAVNLCLGYVNYLRGLNGLPVDAIPYWLNPFSYGPLAPIEVVASCLIFAGFSVMKFKKNCAKLAGYTFLIYLFHGLIWEVTAIILGDRLLGSPVAETAMVVAVSAGVFGLSLFVAVVWKKVGNIRKGE